MSFIPQLVDRVVDFISFTNLYITLLLSMLKIDILLSFYTLVINKASIILFNFLLYLKW